jgi:hypothetical protein
MMCHMARSFSRVFPLVVATPNVVSIACHMSRSLQKILSRQEAYVCPLPQGAQKPIKNAIIFFSLVLTLSITDWSLFSKQMFNI